MQGLQLLELNMVEHVTFCAVITVRHQRTVILYFAHMIPLALEERLVCENHELRRFKIEWW
ncbi:hypothetical protein FOMG_19304 [Fusarium oxysporum f. sp. melonis 26406]|uniref:Uncharacterized protein n=1 Tax=Fusarium oxysporum f. sp. melonis 26406 TaxID=1089452 RepID=W9YXQ4_FUSOX|nr:hypothetical protein FOMG_19304 [Fusarium oxysporum f. sp. melonis 26406]